MKICKKLLIPLFCCLLIGSVIPVCADEGVESAVSEGNIVDIDGEDNDLDEDVEMPLIGNEDDEESKDENRESIGEENIITDEIAGQNEEDTTGDIVESSEIDGAREPAQYTLRSQSDAMQWVKSKEGNKIGTGECVDLIKAYYEYLGVSPVYGNGSDYVGNTLPNGWQRIYKAIPQPGDILVYTGGANNWGHVAIFESTKITYHQNYIGKRFVQRITTVAYNGFDNPYWGVIRPDFNNKWYAALEPVNIGNECYGALIKNSGWATLGVKDSNVEVVKVIGATSEVWHFVRQSDGSYVVYNCEDNRVLEATGGINARVAQYVGGDNQKWYIYGRWSGEWIFRPKSSDYVLDIVNNSNTVGANAQLYGNNNSAAQKFAIYTFEKAGPSSISVSVGNSAAMTKFSWTAGKNVNYYNLRIKKGVPGNVSTYKDVWKIKATSYAIVLPAGYYEVYVDSCNSFSYSASNLIKFNVVQYVPKPVNSLLR